MDEDKLNRAKDIFKKLENQNSLYKNSQNFRNVLVARLLNETKKRIELRS